MHVVKCNVFGWTEEEEDAAGLIRTCSERCMNESDQVFSYQSFSLQKNDCFEELKPGDRSLGITVSLMASTFTHCG